MLDSGPTVQQMAGDLSHVLNDALAPHGVDFVILVVRAEENGQGVEIGLSASMKPERAMLLLKEVCKESKIVNPREESK